MACRYIAQCRFQWPIELFWSNLAACHTRTPKGEQVGVEGGAHLDLPRQGELSELSIGLAGGHYEGHAERPKMGKAL
jgi:hypothetical protein